MGCAASRGPAALQILRPVGTACWPERWQRQQEVAMRSIALFTLALAAAGCAQKSPEQQQLDQIRSDASNQAKAIENQAELQAAPLDQQAEALSNQAKQAGGYTGKRLEVKADALEKEAKLIREQADKQGDAIKEAADARIKTIQSR